MTKDPDTFTSDQFRLPCSKNLSKCSQEQGESSQTTDQDAEKSRTDYTPEESNLSNDEIEEIRNAVTDKNLLRICHKALNLETAEVIVHILQNFSVEHLSEITFRNCEISDKFLKKILSCNVLKCTADTLNLSANAELDMKTVKKVCELLQSKNLDLSDIKMTDAQVRGIAELKGVKTLVLRANTFGGDSMRQSLVTLINGGLEALVLDDSEISSEDLHYLAGNMSKENKLSGLDLSHIALDEKGVKAVRQIVNKAREMDWLHLHDCGLNGRMLEAFNESKQKKSPNASVRRLKLSGNPRIKDSIDTVAKIVENLKCEDIDISRNSMSFKNLVTSSAPSQVSKLSIRENPVENWAALGQLVEKWKKIVSVDASQCQMYDDDAKDFAASLKQRKLKELNVRHTDRDEEFEQKIYSILEHVANTVTIT